MTEYREGDRDIAQAGWVGLATLPLLILALALTAGHFPELWPTSNESTSSIASWFHANRAAGLVQVLAGSVGFVMWIWFVAGLAALLERTGRRSVATRVMTPAAVAASAGIQISDTTWVAALLAGTPGHPMSDDMIHFAFESSVVSYYLAQLNVALLLFAAGYAMREVSTLPKWASISTIGIGIVNALGAFVILIGKGQLAPVSLLSAVPYILFVTWLEACSVALIRKPSTGPGHCTGPHTGEGGS